MSAFSERGARRGFTLIELLVVIAIIAVLIALLVPAVQKVRESAARTTCANNLKQIGIALHSYHDEHGTLPNTRRDYHQTWMVDILPYLEQGTLYRQWDVSKTYYDAANAAARVESIPTYFCPSRRTRGMVSSAGDEPQGTTNPHVPGGLADYAANAGSNGSDYWWNTNNDGTPNAPSDGVFRLANNWGLPTTPSFRPGVRFSDVVDGLSSTFLVGEKHVRLGQFGNAGGDASAYNGDTGTSFRGAGPGRTLARSPQDAATNRFGSYHPSICQFVFCDGSVHIIRNSIDAATLGDLASRHDGNVLSANDY